MSRRLFTIIAGAMAVMFALVLFPLRTHALPPSSDTVYPGIDVSKWQGSIDFDRVKADGIKIVYIRAGAGNDYKDPYFERNYNNAKAARLDIGFYHSMTARSASEAEQPGQIFCIAACGKNRRLYACDGFWRWRPASGVNCKRGGDSVYARG